MTYIIISGNPVDGLTCEGPYHGHDEAVAAGDEVRSDWWVTPLYPPPSDGSPEEEEFAGVTRFGVSVHPDGSLSVTWHAAGSDCRDAAILPRSGGLAKQLRYLLLQVLDGQR